MAADPLAALAAGGDVDRPAFNPWLCAADPRQDGHRRLEGPSQWIASGPVAAGWILATTAAAAGVLQRN